MKLHALHSIGFYVAMPYKPFSSSAVFLIHPEIFFTYDPSNDTAGEKWLGQTAEPMPIANCQLPN